MPFGNPVVGQEDLIRDAIRSTNYVAGSSGWRIAKNGDAEFNEGTFRSELDVTGGDGSFIRGQLSGGHADLLLQPRNVTGFPWNPARLTCGVKDGTGLGDWYPSLIITSPFEDNVAEVPASITLYGPSHAFDTSSVYIDTDNVVMFSSGAGALGDGKNVLNVDTISINSRIIKPIARGSGSASQAGLARNANHKVAINTADIDTDGGIDTANNRYVFPRLGYYRVSYSITLDSFTTPTGTPYAEAWVDLNGVGGNKYGREATPINVASDTVALSGSEIIEATALTDYVELYARYNNGTAGTTMQILAGALFPTLTVEFVG